MPDNEQRPSQGDESARMKDLSVKGIPEQVWIKARYNAMQSRMPFRDYIVRILEDCPVFKTEEAT